MRTLTFRGIGLLLVWMIGGGLPVAQAQTGEDILRFSERAPAVTPRATGLGGASIAGIGDYNAFFTNPAGLGLIRRSYVGGSLSFLNAEESAAYRTTGFAGTVDNTVSNTRLGHLAYLYKMPTVRGSLVIGGGFSQVQAFERDLLFEGENGNNSITDFFMPLPSEFSLEENGDGTFNPTFSRPLSFIAYEAFGIDLDPDLATAYASGADVNPFLPAVTFGTVRQTGSVLEEGSLNEINLGAAVEAAPNLMVGASLNIPFGVYRFNRVFEEDDFQDDNDGSNGTTDFEGLFFEEGFESSIVGANLRLGVSSLVSPRIRLGLTVETPTYYTVEEDYTTRLETFFDNGDAFSYGDDFDEDAGMGSFQYEMITPWRLGTGIALNQQNVSVYGDLEFVDWSQMELNSDDFTFEDENRRIRQDFSSVINTRVGVEFRTNQLALRGGLAYQPDPRDFDTRTAEGATLDRSRTFLSAGLGYRFSDQMQLDVAWQQQRFDDQYLPYTEVNEAPVVDEEVIRNHLTVGVRVLF